MRGFVSIMGGNEVNAGMMWLGQNATIRFAPLGDFLFGSDVLFFSTDNDSDVAEGYSVQHEPTRVRFERAN